MTPLSRNYAQALLESAPQGFDPARFLESGHVLERLLLGDARLRAFFATPGIPAEAKAKALEELARRAGVDDYGRRFLAVVLANRRILQLPEILAGVSQTYDARKGVVAARVTVPEPLGEAERERLEKALSERVGKTVRMQVDVDPKLLAGFVARVGSSVFDASAAQMIERFKSEARQKTGA